MLLLAVLLACLHAAAAQYIKGSYLYEELLSQKQADLDELLKNHEDLSGFYYPMKFAIPREYYM